MTAPILRDEAELMDPVAVHLWRQRRADLFRDILEPPELLTGSQWADRFRILSRESSGEPGQWSTDRTPYLREIMDACTDPLVEEVVFMKPARIGGTEAGNNILGYFIDQDPCPILMVLPTVDMAKAWSKEQFAPMLRDTPVLQGKVEDARARDSGNTILQKLFPGGTISVVGANSAVGFRMRSIRVLVMSEVDAYADSAGTEGDPIELGKTRTQTFSNRKIYIESSPGLRLTSRIEPAFLRGDQRRFYVPCPHCKHAQVLVWKNLRYKEVTEPVYACEECGQFIPEEEKYRMNERGKWVPAAPFKGTRSYHVNQLYSPFDGARWGKLVERWEAAQGDNQQLKVFVNTVLAETWEERGGKVAPALLQERKRDYGVEVPSAVQLLVGAVDTQDDRLELKVKGYGPGCSSALIAFSKVMGSPGRKETWDELDRLRRRVFTKADGTKLRLAGTGVDTRGHFTDEAYAYVKRCMASGERVYALAGAKQPGAPALPRKPTRNNSGRVPLYTIGVGALKSTVFARLKVTEPGPGVMWFPHWATDDYFLQLTSETPIRAYINGRWTIKWYVPPNARNEAWDLEVYCLAVLKIIGREGWLMSLPWVEWKFGETPPPLPAPAEGDPPPETPEEPDNDDTPRRPRRRGGYIRDLRNLG